MAKIPGIRGMWIPPPYPYLWNFMYPNVLIRCRLHFPICKKKGKAQPSWIAVFEISISKSIGIPISNFFFGSPHPDSLFTLTGLLFATLLLPLDGARAVPRRLAGAFCRASSRCCSKSLIGTFLIWTLGPISLYWPLIWFVSFYGQDL